MENVMHRLSLDLTKPDAWPRVEVQKDNARTLVVSLTQNGRPYWIAEGVTAVFSARKPDGNKLFNGCTVEKNAVRYDFTDQTTNVVGITECEILLYSGDERILASPRFELAVDDLIHQEGDIPESASECTALTQMVAAGTAMIEDLREALAGLEGVEEILTEARGYAESAAGYAEHAKSFNASASVAAAAAQSASGAATQAADRAETAQTAAQSAQTAAEAARTAAELAEIGAAGASVTASQQANSAAQSAQAAEHAAGQAQEAAGGAQTAMLETQTALNAAQTAQRTAAFAAEKAETAREAAELAETGAAAASVTASQQANSAAQSAQASADAAERAETAAQRAEEAAGGGNGGGADLTGYATQEWVRTGYQPKGHYLTEETLDSAVEDALMEAQESGKFDGADGRGIKSVVRTSGNGAAGTVDTYTITYTDNTTSTFQVRNGANGKDGAQGPQGDPGRTPVKGEDYFTADDIAAMVQATVEALPQYAGEVTYV